MSDEKNEEVLHEAPSDFEFLQEKSRSARLIKRNC